MLINALYFIICLAATTLGAISGIGGGVIIKPVLDSISSMPVSHISFLSGCTVLAMSVVSMFRLSDGEDKVNPVIGACLAVGGVTGGIAGKGLFESLKAQFSNEPLLGTIQNLVMILLTCTVFIYMLNKNSIQTRHVKNPVICLLIGIFLGVLSSFLGIGGGPINLMMLYFFFSMNTKTAAINSIFIILFSQIASLISALISGSVPPVDYTILAVMVSGGILGGLLGNKVSKQLSAKHIDGIFKALLVSIILISVYNVCRFSAQI